MFCDELYIQHKDSWFKFTDVKADGNCMYYCLAKCPLTPLSSADAIRKVLAEIMRKPSETLMNFFVEHHKTDDNPEPSLQEWEDAVLNDSEWGSNFESSLFGAIFGIDVRIITNTPFGLEECDTKTLLTMYEIDAEKVIPNNAPSFYLYLHKHLQPEQPTQKANHFGFLELVKHDPPNGSKLYKHPGTMNNPADSTTFQESKSQETMTQQGERNGMTPVAVQKKLSQPPSKRSDAREIQHNQPTRPSGVDKHNSNKLSGKIQTDAHVKLSSQPSPKRYDTSEVQQKQPSRKINAEKHHAGNNPPRMTPNNNGQSQERLNTKDIPQKQQSRKINAEKNNSSKIATKTTADHIKPSQSSQTISKRVEKVNASKASSKLPAEDYAKSSAPSQSRHDGRETLYRKDARGPRLNKLERENLGEVTPREKNDINSNIGKELPVPLPSGKKRSKKLELARNELLTHEQHNNTSAEDLKSEHLRDGQTAEKYFETTHQKSSSRYQHDVVERMNEKLRAQPSDRYNEPKKGGNRQPDPSLDIKGNTPRHYEEQNWEQIRESRRGRRTGNTREQDATQSNNYLNQGRDREEEKEIIKQAKGYPNGRPVAPSNSRRRDDQLNSNRVAKGAGREDQNPTIRDIKAREEEFRSKNGNFKAVLDSQKFKALLTGQSPVRSVSETRERRHRDELPAVEVRNNNSNGNKEHEWRPRNEVDEMENQEDLERVQRRRSFEDKNYPRRDQGHRREEGMEDDAHKNHYHRDQGHRRDEGLDDDRIRARGQHSRLPGPLGNKNNSEPGRRQKGIYNPLEESGNLENERRTIVDNARRDEDIQDQGRRRKKENGGYEEDNRRRRNELGEHPEQGRREIQSRRRNGFDEQDEGYRDQGRRRRNETSGYEEGHRRRRNEDEEHPEEGRREMQSRRKSNESDQGDQDQVRRRKKETSGYEEDHRRRRNEYDEYPEDGRREIQPRRRNGFDEQDEGCQDQGRRRRKENDRYEEDHRRRRNDHEEYTQEGRREALSHRRNEGNEQDEGYLDKCRRRRNENIGYEEDHRRRRNEHEEYSEEGRKEISSRRRNGFDDHDEGYRDQGRRRRNENGGYEEDHSRRRRNEHGEHQEELRREIQSRRRNGFNEQDEGYQDQDRRRKNENGGYEEDHRRRRNEYEEYAEEGSRELSARQRNGYDEQDYGDYREPVGRRRVKAGIPSSSSASRPTLAQNDHSLEENLIQEGNMDRRFDNHRSRREVEGRKTEGRRSSLQAPPGHPRSEKLRLYDSRGTKSMSQIDQKGEAFHERFEGPSPSRRHVHTRPSLPTMEEKEVQNAPQYGRQRSSRP